MENNKKYWLLFYIFYTTTAEMTETLQEKTG